MDPIAGLLRPEDRRRSKNLGLLTAGLSMIQNSGWQPAGTNPGTISNLAGAAMAGLGAYEAGNAKALEVQQYKQQVAAQQAQQQAMAQREQRVKQIIEGIGTRGTFGTQSERQAWVARANAADLEGQVEAIQDYEQGLQGEDFTLNPGDRRYNSRGELIVEAPSEDDGDPWYDEYSPQTRRYMAQALQVGDLDDPRITNEMLENLDWDAIEQMEMRQAEAGGTKVQIGAPGAEGGPMDEAVNEGMLEFTTDEVKALRAGIKDVGAKLNYMRMRSNLPGSPITGAFSDERYFVSQLAQLAGISSDEMDLDIGATQAVRSMLGQGVLAGLASGALGSGSGISDKDMETMHQIQLADLGDSEAGRLQAMYFTSLIKQSEVYVEIEAMREAGEISTATYNQLMASARTRMGTAEQLKRKFLEMDKEYVRREQLRLRNANASEAEIAEVKRLMPWIEDDLVDLQASQVWGGG